MTDFDTAFDETVSDQLARARELHTACRAYCKLMDIPIITARGDESLLHRAVLDYDGDFAQLNEVQIRAIAGIVNV